MNNSLNLIENPPGTGATNTPKSAPFNEGWSTCPTYPFAPSIYSYDTKPNTAFNNITPSTGSEKLPTNIEESLDIETLNPPQSNSTTGEEKVIHIELLNENHKTSKSPETIACHCIDRKLPYTVNEKNVWQVFEISDCKFVQTKLEHYETLQCEQLDREEFKETEITPQHSHSRSSFDENQFICHNLLDTPMERTPLLPPPSSAPKTCESCCFCNPNIHSNKNAECNYCKNRTPQVKTEENTTKQYYETLAIDHTHTTEENNTMKCTKISETVSKRITSSANTGTSTGTIKKINKIDEKTNFTQISKSPTKLLNRPKENVISQPRKRIKSVKKEIKNEINKIYPIAIEVKDKKVKKTR